MHRATRVSARLSNFGNAFASIRFPHMCHVVTSFMRGLSVVCPIALDLWLSKSAASQLSHVESNEKHQIRSSKELGGLRLRRFRRLTPF